MKKKGILSTCIILAIAIACAAIAGNSFNKKRNFVEDIVTEGTNVTEVFKLSRYRSEPSAIRRCTSSRAKRRAAAS